jgi:hypothetical protein
MYVHALHTVHALPDLRIAAGRLRDGCSHKISITFCVLTSSRLFLGNCARSKHNSCPHHGLALRLCHRLQDKSGNGNSCASAPGILVDNLRFVAADSHTAVRHAAGSDFLRVVEPDSQSLARKSGKPSHPVFVTISMVDAALGPDHVRIIGTV